MASAKRGPREGPVLAARLVDHRNVRRDVLFIDQPGQHSGIAICSIASQLFGLELEALLGTFDHRAGRAHWGRDFAAFSLGYRKVPFDQTYTNHNIELAPNTNFVMVTDGIIDQVGGSPRRTFGKRRFLDVMTSNASRPLPEQGEALMAELERYQGDEIRRDDVSLIAFTV